MNSFLYKIFYITYVFNVNINWNIIQICRIFNFKEFFKEILGLFVILFYFNEYLCINFSILSNYIVLFTLIFNLVSYFIIAISIFSGAFLNSRWILLITRSKLYSCNIILHWFYFFNILIGILIWLNLFIFVKRIPE